jgi:hypothetical protein
VGGSITGFTSGNLVLQFNKGNDLTLTPTNQYSYQNISQNQNYEISVKKHPTGLSCSIINEKGIVTGNISNVNLSCISFTAKSLYDLGNPNQSYWLDYVKSDGTNPLNATGTACTGTETGFYNACIHAGEFRKFDIPNLNSCAGITASDSLGVFQWRCMVSSNGSVFVTSTGLKDEKGLSDLVNFDTSTFNTIFVTIFKENVEFLKSNPSVWWNNPIVKDNSGSTLNTPYTIYITDSSVASFPYLLSASKIALLSKKGFLKTFISSAATSVWLNTANLSFNWVEGNFSNSNTTQGVIFFNPNNKFHVLRNMAILSLGSTASINNNACSGCYFTNISGTNTNTSGVWINMNNPRNILRNLTGFNSQGNITNLTNKDTILLDSVFMNSSANGINSDSNTYTNNLLLNVSSMNHTSSGLTITNNSNNLTTMNFLAGNTGASNLFIQANNDSKFINTTLAHNSGSQIFHASVTNSRFNGILKIGTGTCNVTTSSQEGIFSDCSRQNNSELTPATVTGVTLANSFVGKVNSDSKTLQTLGLNPTTVAITNGGWLFFENRFRGWGKPGSSFPSNTNTGRCLGDNIDTCSIWDWSLKSSDTIIRNVNSCPSTNIVDTHTWSAVNNTSCLEIKGAVWGTSCVTTFLRNAVEIFGDGIGNENGICESNEECIYTPNIGAYQGHGNLVSASTSTSTTNNCSDLGSGGTISNVKLWKYETNGY